MAGAAALAVSLAACGTNTAAPPASSTPPPPASPALPPRPANLPLNGVQPCGLIAGPAVRQLGVGPGVATGAVQNGTARCQWTTLPPQPADTYLARVQLDQGAAAALRDPRGAEVVEVDGFPAVQTTAPDALPDRSCSVFVDVAPNQALVVDYLSSTPNAPGMNHAAACQKARTAAGFMVTTLRGLIQQSH